MKKGLPGEQKEGCRTRQLEYWTSAFGDAYIDRNDGEAHALRRPFFEELLQRSPGVESILEVGCNVAWNLKVLGDIRPRLVLAGVEPNARALQIAQARYPGLDLRAGSAFGLPFAGESFDLVMTVGVLIHIAPTDLERALSEMLRVSRRYVLTVEYFSEHPVTVPYRGLPDALFKCDWLEAWKRQAPNLRLDWAGELDKSQGFDDCRYWLMQKS